MCNERSTELAKQILEDLRGATYYADPSILGPLLKSDHESTKDCERAAIEVLRHLLHKYVPTPASENDVQELAQVLKGIGVR